MDRLFGDARCTLGDCLTILPTLGKVGHVICDAPYEDVLHDAVGRISRTDGQQIPKDFGFAGIDTIRPQLAKLMVAASDGWILAFCIAEGVRAWRDALQAAGAKYDTCLAWVKPDAMPRFNGQGASRGFECIVTAWAGKGYRAWNGGGRRGVLYHARAEEHEHPTQKPISLMKELVGLYTNPGDTVLDPMMGSGSTGVACAKMGRKFIGIEQQEKWYDLACKRIEEAQKQGDMFIAPLPTAKQQSFL